MGEADVNEETYDLFCENCDLREIFNHVFYLPLLARLMCFA